MAKEINQPSIEENAVAVPKTQAVVISDVQKSIDYVNKFCANFQPKEKHAVFNYQLSSKGWQFGEVLDEAAKTHPALVNWKKLSPELRQQELDLFPAPSAVIEQENEK